MGALRIHKEFLRAMKSVQRPEKGRWHRIFFLHPKLKFENSTLEALKCD